MSKLPPGNMNASIGSYSIDLAGDQWSTHRGSKVGIPLRQTARQICQDSKMSSSSRLSCISILYIYIHIYPSYTSQKTGGFITMFNPYLFKTQPTHWAQPVRNEALLAGYLQEGLQVDCKNWTQIPTVGRRSNKTTTKNHTKSTKKRQSS